MEMESTNRTMLTVPEAAEHMGIRKTMAYELAARNELPGMVRIGRLVKVHRPTLERWLEEQAAGSVAALGGYMQRGHS